MAERRFGPTNGAGTVIIELEGEKQITPGALGFVGYAGTLEKGDVGELIQATNKKTFEKKCGGIIPDSLLPDSAFDYYDLANGAGGILLVRVTDGNELAAELPLFVRNANLQVQLGTVKAKNGGRWGGKQLRFTDDFSIAADLQNTTLTTGNANFTTDQWKGGFLELEDVPNVRFPIVGNTNAGVISVAADQTMRDQYDALSGTSLRYFLTLENEAKAVSILIEDGEEKANEEFALTIFVDGVFTKKYPNLNTDPTSPRYWVDLINDDTGNDEIEVVDLFTGAHTANTRPANHYGLVDSGIGAFPPAQTVMPAVIHDFAITFSPTGANPTMTLDATDDDMIAQSITLTVLAGDGTASVVSDKFGDLGTLTIGNAFVPNNKWAPEITVDNGAELLVEGDIMVVNYKPFVPDSLINGFLFPDKVVAPTTRFRIVDNDHDSITIAAGGDVTLGGTVDGGEEFLVEAPLELEAGRDGNADISNTDFEEQAWDVSDSPFNRVIGRNLGLIKFGTPGNTATAVQKAGVAYADAKNHQYRYEIPDTVVTEEAAIDLINNTLGRSDFAVVAFPSYGSVPDPDAGTEGKLKTVSLTGMIHGREARIAEDFSGYHKAEAGIDAVLPRLLEIPTGETILNEELLNPVGIATIKKIQGNFIIWGDRTVNLDPAFRFKHQRELLSFYEHVLQENFDFIIFAINDRDTDSLAIAALRSFFLPEFVKRAVRGDTFEDAVQIKLDDELNTDASRANGDLIVEVLLRLADTVERFIIRIGKSGIFEAVG